MPQVHHSQGEEKAHPWRASSSFRKQPPPFNLVVDLVMAMAARRGSRRCLGLPSHLPPLSTPELARLPQIEQAHAGVLARGIAAPNRLVLQFGDGRSREGERKECPVRGCRKVRGCLAKGGRRGGRRRRAGDAPAKPCSKP